MDSKKLMKGLKSFFDWSVTHDFDKAIEYAEAKEGIRRVKAEKHLKEMGWNILSCNSSLGSSDFKIQKGDHIYVVTTQEALNLI